MMTGQNIGWLFIVSLTIASASPLLNYNELQEEGAPLTTLAEQLEQTISDGGEDVNEENSPIEILKQEEEEAEQETEANSKMDLDAFLSQFVLIKTPYGYILARAPQQQQEPMTRTRRGRHTAESNFQLRVRKDDSENSGRMLNWMDIYRERKATGTPFKAQHNFQLRVRKNSGPQPQQVNLSGIESGTRVRKALLQEIRDRRRSVADHSNNNFQLRVRKSNYGGRSGPGQNFQLRVRRSADGTQA